MRDTTPEKDARNVKWFLYSTGLDQACVVNMMLQITGDGGNGKSVEIDNVMYVLGTDYATKLSSNLLMGKSKPGQADNDLMQMKSKNIGFICETDQNDVIVASRLKTLAEFIKTGRKNYGDPENFQTNCTVIVATNFALNIVDTDYGTFRRTAIYRQPFKYVSKPNPKYPEEKQMDRKYERLSMNNSDMADGLFACLVHKRIKFHKKYNSEIDKVPMPTIEKYTNEYRKQQNSVMSFLSVKLVMLKGYAKDGTRRDDITEGEIADYYLLNNITYTETITLDDIIISYRNWYKTIGVLNKNDEILKNEFRQSAVGKLFKDKDNGRVVELNGYRILEPGKRKLDEERYFM
jgi:phage/plasmid-associated DNA primase